MSLLWDIVRSVLFAVLVVAMIEWIVAWRRGERTVRDERGRLKPAVAVAAILLPLFVASLVASAISS